MSPTSILVVLACSATAHWVIACVMSLYARHQVRYLCLACVHAIFAASITLTTFFNELIAVGHPGVLHPLMLLALVCMCFLQSIYPLSIPMPGFLQWGRMLRYAYPAIVLICFYLLALSVGGKLIIVNSFSDILTNIISSDLLLRLAALALSIYYIVNIFRLPRIMVHKTEVPRYLIGYCTVMGLMVMLYVFVTIFYSPLLLMTYVVLFTMVNLYLVFRVLETMAVSLPKPVLSSVLEAPSEEEVVEAEKQDFNEANLQRFQRIQYWMQQHRDEWTDNTFGRDRLCEAVGYNRHVILQSVRSQGYNNVHDFINDYRISRLKQLILRGEVKSVSDALTVGFGTAKTARSCFEKSEGISLDVYLAQNTQ